MELIGFDESPTQGLGQHFADRRLAGTGHSHQHDDHRRLLNADQRDALGRWSARARARDVAFAVPQLNRKPTQVEESRLHNHASFPILKDRAYIGDIEFRGEWYPGKHTPLVDRATWNRVQALLGGHVYQSLSLTYASELIQCGHCGHPITGERITKKTKTGERYYTYYRCTYYTKPGHPRTRVPDAALEVQVMAIFDKMRVEDESVRDWFRLVLASQTRDAQEDARAQRAELQRQETLIVAQQDRLLNMRLSEDIEQETFARKHTEMRDRLASIKLQLDVLDRSHDETVELAAKVLNFRKHYGANGLPPITLQSVESSKSCF